MLFSAFKKLTDELYFKFFICIWRQKKTGREYRPASLR